VRYGFGPHSWDRPHYDNTIAPRLEVMECTERMFPRPWEEHANRTPGRCRTGEGVLCVQGLIGCIALV
jgi:hypothetical protein